MYWRLFLWFIASNVIVIVVGAVIVLPWWQAMNLNLSYNGVAQGHQVLKRLHEHGRRTAQQSLMTSHRDTGVLGILQAPDGHLVLVPPGPRFRQVMRDLGNNMQGQTKDGRRVQAYIVETPEGQWRWIAVFDLDWGSPSSTLKLGVNIGVGLIVMLVFAWLASRWLSRPLRQLQYNVERLSQGDFTERVDPALLTRGDELGDLSLKFNEMASKLEALLHRQRQLISDVSHELRSPLARLRLLLEMEREDQDRPRLLKIERETERLNELLDQVLTVSRLEQSQEEQLKAPVDLSELVAEVAEDAQLECQKKQQRLLTHIAPGLGLNADAASLRSAVENPLRNAIRHTPKHGLVEVHLAQVGQDAQLIISDSGPGVAEGHLQMMFDPFWRASAARDRHSGGYGLGLAICKRAVLSHAGSIEAHNKPQGGLQVTITLAL